jgi:hypothetical protein
MGPGVYVEMSQDIEELPDGGISESRTTWGRIKPLCHP